VIFKYWNKRTLRRELPSHHHITTTPRGGWFLVFLDHIWWHQRLKSPYLFCRVGC